MTWFSDINANFDIYFKTLRTHSSIVNASSVQTQHVFANGMSEGGRGEEESRGEEKRRGEGRRERGEGLRRREVEEIGANSLFHFLPFSSLSCYLLPLLFISSRYIV